jgi:two-component sensor histidine kinase
LVSIGEYDHRTGKFSKDHVLLEKDFPVYFKALAENKIINAEDIYSHPLTLEFTEVYSKPQGIVSLLDIPIRISGELVGVMCYEKTNEAKVFSSSEISFCLSVSLVLASNLETRHRRAAQALLEEALEEKELLIKEINHRVKNNFSILISLMRLSKRRAKTKDAKGLLDEYEQRIFSMLKIHEMLNKTSQFNEINLAEYLSSLTTEFRFSYPQIDQCFQVRIDPIPYMITTHRAIHLGLIVSEILINSIKYASESNSTYEVLISLKESEDKTVLLEIGDNGAGFDFHTVALKETLGLPLIKDLAESLEFKARFPVKGKCYYSFEFEID